MKKITNPSKYEICKFDGVNESTVYLGYFDNLKKIDMKWRKETNEYIGDIEVLTLDEIREQIYEKSRGIITIFVNTPMRGEILQYGNYGDSWWEVGSHCGYA